jgi:hypothetical protein
MGQGAEGSVCAAGLVDSPGRAEVERVATAIVDAAVRVHKALGPGLLESAYEQCLAHALRRRGLHVDCQVVLPVTLEGLAIDASYAHRTLASFAPLRFRYLPWHTPCSRLLGGLGAWMCAGWWRWAQARWRQR